MFGIENYTGFIIAAIILNLTPGADTFYVLTRCVAQGRKAGLVSVAGIMTGCVVHVLCAAFGLSVILSTSALVFNLVKWAGALYLIYLGIRTLMDKSPAFDDNNGPIANGNLALIYRQGIITNVLNPKVALFFLSFLPQFININQASGPIPFLLLGGTFLLTGTTWLLILAGAAALMTRTLRGNNKIGLILQKLSGIIFIGFGLKLAFDSK
ncbi:MAG: LysE family translocator [Desulfobacterales bacterium]|nr:LysE family translocator [Desulfobacterales bacterium]